MKRFFITVFALFLVWISTNCREKPFLVNQSLDYCLSKLNRSILKIPGYSHMPRTIEFSQKDWKYVPIEDWTSGFWPGILWYATEYTNESKWQARADSFTRALFPLAYRKAGNHDLGFMMYCSYGNAYRLTKNPDFKKVLLATADTLATLYNPKVGTILSWPSMVKEQNWPHNTIIDNLINLEVLFWAAKNGGKKELYDIALKHAQTTMKNHFRPDYTSYQVIVYDTITGKKIKGVTHQGYADNSMWARGQAWAIYGFVMTYRETRRPEFLNFAQKIAEVYLERLPENLIPYWDFNDPAIPDAPKDASAAAITSSALLELSALVSNQEKKKEYRRKAEEMLKELSSDDYLSGNKNNAFLMHSIGHHPHGTEIDASIIYADYYYMEALIRLKKIQEGKSIYANL